MKSRNPTFRRAVAVALAVGAYLLVIDLMFQPVYARGVAQGVLSHLNGLSSLLAVPGFLVAQAVGIRRGHHTTLGVWWFILMTTVVIYTVGVAIAIQAWSAIGRKLRRMKAPQKNTELATDAPPIPGPRVSRRRVLTGGAGSLAAAAAVGYPMSVATRRVEITRRTFPVRNFPPELNGLRLVQLTDIHHGPWIPISHVRDIVAAANALNPDLVLLTGDYVHRSAVYIDPVIQALAGLRAKLGVVGVLGNHDWWEDGPATQRAFARAGIPLIDNARRFVTPDRHMTHGTPDHGLCIAGVGDYYEDEQLYDAALGGVPAGMPRLLLSHNPDVAEDRAFRTSGHRVDLMLSGHTHGGQIFVPGLGTPIVPSRYGQKYARGLVQGPACPVFISRGVGHTVLPVRVGIPPEIAVIELTRA